LYRIEPPQFTFRQLPASNSGRITGRCNSLSRLCTSFEKRRLVSKPLAVNGWYIETSRLPSCTTRFRRRKDIITTTTWICLPSWFIETTLFSYLQIKPQVSTRGRDVPLIFVLRRWCRDSNLGADQLHRESVGTRPARFEPVTSSLAHTSPRHFIPKSLVRSRYISFVFTLLNFGMNI
jgi:hypothetical protein